jgi:hypothetical protein
VSGCPAEAVDAATEILDAPRLRPGRPGTQSPRSLWNGSGCQRCRCTTATYLGAKEDSWSAARIVPGEMAYDRTHVETGLFDDISMRTQSEPGRLPCGVQILAALILGGA